MYSVDAYWLPQMWLDRGGRPQAPLRDRAPGLGRRGLEDSCHRRRRACAGRAMGRGIGHARRRAPHPRRHHRRRQAPRSHPRDQRAVALRASAGGRQRRAARVGAERPRPHAAALSSVGQLRHARRLPRASRVGHDQHQVRQGRGPRDEPRGRARRRPGHSHARGAQSRVGPGLHADLPGLGRHVRDHHRSDDADHAAARDEAVPRRCSSTTWSRGSRPAGR